MRRQFPLTISGLQARDDHGDMWSTYQVVSAHCKSLKPTQPVSTCVNPASVKRCITFAVRIPKFALQKVYAAVLCRSSAVSFFVASLSRGSHAGRWSRRSLVSALGRPVKRLRQMRRSVAGVVYRLCLSVQLAQQRIDYDFDFSGQPLLVSY